MQDALHIRPYDPDDEAQVIELWRQCGLLVPWNDPSEDIARKLSTQPELFLIATVDRTITGTVMAGYDGHRGWINYLAVSPAWRGHGYGRRLVLAAEEVLASRGCPKVNLQVRASNAAVIDFYRRLGYGVEEVVSMGKRFR